MDPLPKASQSTQPPSGISVSPISGSMAKEQAPGVAIPESPIVTEIGKEIDLPPEVQRAGVTMQSDAVVLPNIVQHMGVSAVGAAVPSVIPAPASVVLPLTDDQIAQGLHQSLISSWRWLAEWCQRQLKGAHILLTTTHGKIVRTKTE